MIKYSKRQLEELELFQSYIILDMLYSFLDVSSIAERAGNIGVLHKALNKKISYFEDQHTKLLNGHTKKMSRKAALFYQASQLSILARKKTKLKLIEMTTNKDNDLFNTNTNINAIAIRLIYLYKEELLKLLPLKESNLVLPNVEYANGAFMNSVKVANLTISYMQEYKEKFYDEFLESINSFESLDIGAEMLYKTINEALNLAIRELGELLIPGGPKN